MISRITSESPECGGIALHISVVLSRDEVFVALHILHPPPPPPYIRHKAAASAPLSTRRRRRRRQQS